MEMGESACLRRSLSSPSQVFRQAREGDPNGALTESISFGRFMLEPLAWEKWSTFSHNRYLEEVELLFKPGYVAQKKAFFEAHYKKRAAMKAAALLGQENTAAEDAAKLETADGTCNSSSMNSELPKASSDVVIEEQHVLTADAKTISEIGQTDMVEESEAGTRESVDTKNSIQFEDQKQLEIAEDYDKIVARPEERMTYKETDNKETAALCTKKRLVSNISRLSDINKASKLSKTSVKRASFSTRQAGITSSRISAGFIDKKKLPSKSVHMSIGFSSHSGENDKSSLQKSKVNSTTPRNPTRASVHGLVPLATCLLEYKRKNLAMNESVSGENLNGGSLQTVTEDRTKSSSATSGSKAKPPTMSSPFRFRSEEQAAKRQEFFQKLEEKSNAREAEKIHLEDKQTHKLRKLQQRTDFRSRLNEASHHESQSRNHANKMPLTRPQSPKLGRKLPPSELSAQERTFKLTRRTLVNAEISKHATLKYNQSFSSSTKSLQKTRARENASPNIQR